MNAFLRDKEALIWREIASILVPVVVLNILFFTLLGRGRYVGEGEIQYVSFLMFALVGLGICAISYHTVGLLERAFFWSKSKGKIVFTLAKIVLFVPVVPLGAAFYFVLMPRSAMLVLAALLIILLFLVFYARMSYLGSLYEVYLRVLLPSMLFFLFLGVTVFDIDAFGVYALSSYAYFFVRPFINYFIRVRPPSV